jgi:hypothetical protein
MRREIMGFTTEIVVTRTIHPKCPRCYRHTPEGHFNFDHLCDRCCTVILDLFPNHWSVPDIKAKIREFREMTPAQRREMLGWENAR